MDLRDRKDMLELKRTRLDHAEKQLEDLRRKTDEHGFCMVIIDGDNMPVSTLETGSPILFLIA